MTVGDLDVNQKAQANAEAMRLHRLFGERVPMAGMGGVAGAPDSTVPGMGGVVGPELRANVCAGARRSKAATGHSGTSGALWDRSRRLQELCGRIAIMFSRVLMNPWYNLSCFWVLFRWLPRSPISEVFSQALRTGNLGNLRILMRPLNLGCYGMLVD